jgi:hypothetical protein
LRGGDSAAADRVWDAVEIVEFSRKHTANVHECFGQIREIIGRLVEKRDQRRDGFAATIRRAMETTLVRSAADVLKVLAKQGIPRAAAKEALEIAAQRGWFTIFCVVDALTRLAGRIKHAGPPRRTTRPTSGPAPCWPWQPDSELNVRFFEALAPPGLSFTLLEATKSARNSLSIRRDWTLLTFPWTVPRMSK